MFCRSREWKWENQELLFEKNENARIEKADAQCKVIRNLYTCFIQRVLYPRFLLLKFYSKATQILKVFIRFCAIIDYSALVTDFCRLMSLQCKTFQRMGGPVIWVRKLHQAWTLVTTVIQKRNLHQATMKQNYLAGNDTIKPSLS